MTMSYLKTEKITVTNLDWLAERMCDIYDTDNLGPEDADRFLQAWDDDWSVDLSKYHEAIFTPLFIAYGVNRVAQLREHFVAIMALLGETVQYQDKDKESHPGIKIANQKHNKFVNAYFDLRKAVQEQDKSASIDKWREKIREMLKPAGFERMADYLEISIRDGYVESVNLSSFSSINDDEYKYEYDNDFS